MATYTINIDPDAFLAGGPLVKFAADMNKVRIPIGQTFDVDNATQAMLVSNSMANYKTDTKQGILTITLNTIEFDESLYAKFSFNIKNQLASLVQKEIIIVKKGGVAQTFLQVATG